MNTCLNKCLSTAIGHIEDVTDAADRAIVSINAISSEVMRLQAKGVRLPRRLLRLIESAESPIDDLAALNDALAALDRADEFVSAMELQGIKS